MSHEPRRRSRTRPGQHAAVRHPLVTLLVTAVTVPAALALAPERFPYIPTTILAPAVSAGEEPGGNADSNRAYIFRQKDGLIDFSSLNISAEIDDKKGWKTLSSELPFLKTAPDTTAFSPTLTESGDLVVYVGNCDSSSDYAIWAYSPSHDDGGDSEWEKRSTTISDGGDLKYPGPNFLGASISFSSQIEPSVSEPVLYSFGGMCPNSTAGEVASWQSAARYTNQMLKASLSGSEYKLSEVSSKGPVREAGFTLTRLNPSRSYRGDIVTQGVSYLLLGGHTKEAFINMSTAAVWNLPEETWSFVNVKSPATRTGELRAGSSLMRRWDGVTVDSRSGHTTVLSEDGTTLTLLGGWVGTVDRAAEPQLVTLKMGASYDEWQWVVPDQQPEGPGVYGHGAALLPGNVMMVDGGYEIAAATGQPTKREEFSNGPRFLNLTTMEWSSAYTSPSGPSRISTDPTEQDEEAKDGKAKRLGLGIGLGLGIPILIAAAVLLFFYRKFARRKRIMRDDAIRALAQDRALFLQGESEMSEREYDNTYDAHAWAQPTWYTGGSDPYDVTHRSLGYETLRGGRNAMSMNPAALQIPRKPAVPRTSRSTYQAAASSIPSGIHPIYEADEDAEYQQRESAGLVDPSPEESPSNPGTPTSKRYSDPFVSPPAPSAPALHPSGRASATPSPEGLRMDPEVHYWMTGVDAAEDLLARRDQRQGGRTSSPSKPPNRPAGFVADDDARTGSNLSESARSALSSITRSTSGRSHFRAGFGLFPGASAAAEGRLDSSSSSNPSYNTAKSSFTVLQSEGPGLLRGGEAEQQYDPPHQHHRGAPDDDGQEDDFGPAPGSPSKMKPRRGWLGSLKRAFTPSGASYEAAPEESPTRHSFEHGPADYEARPHRLSSIGGGSLLRRKQGKHAWADETGEYDLEGALGRAPESEAEPRRSGETDWDIERAVEQRLVQVMFTVPKERLRVVNAEVERDEGSFVEGGRVSPGARSLAGGRTSPAARTPSGEQRDGRVPSSRRGEEEGTFGSSPALDSLPALEHSFTDGPSSPRSVYGELHDVDMDEDATVAPLALPNRDGLRTPVTPDRSAKRDYRAEEEDGARLGTPLSTAKSRVLEIVESIESRSRDGSPRRHG
ncbi:uncharacterized protein DNG_08521 [Cephalotrichum gorgonifer]|uniref:Uncharacterized protein n=1 Tax=Cephalotrichum gorgonifer TaxID=2041049 RepID=A0AAE8SYG4_9PEZI|nr:uncharacterized protein DNG_08521 [Cephalotrichum gorgonifer]